MKILSNNGELIYEDNEASITKTFLNAVKNSISLINANLANLTLEGVHIENADFRWANFEGSTFKNSKFLNCALQDTRFANCDISSSAFCNCFAPWSKFSGAKVYNVQFDSCEFKYSRFSNATIKDSTFYKSLFNEATFTDSNVENAKFIQSNFSDANFSGSKGFVVNPKQFLSQFKKTRSGIYVYKAIGKTSYRLRNEWVIKPGSYLEEVVNPSPFDNCGCGVNFGTMDFVRTNYREAQIWLCLIEWEDVASIVVPTNTDGKARCARLKLVKKV